MLSILGIAVSGNQKLIKSTRNVLQTLAKNQTERGHIPSLVHDKEDRGSSDTTPLFLLGVGIFRKLVNEPNFLEKFVQKALIWLAYQSPPDCHLIAQQPISDWRDEQWVVGYGLYVNTLVYSYLRLLGHDEKAAIMNRELDRFIVTGDTRHHHIHDLHGGLVVKYKPYYALWSYKILNSERFDLLGNSLAILNGIASPTRAPKIISWVEEECEKMRNRGILTLDLPPNFFPFIQPQDPDWHERITIFNKPRRLPQRGVWPFACGFYIAALVAAEKYTLAEKNLIALTDVIQQSKNLNIDFGFNEWHKAQTGKPMGQNWQTWSAALYLYAAKCVETRQAPFFDEMRSKSH